MYVWFETVDVYTVYGLIYWFETVDVYTVGKS